MSGSGKSKRGFASMDANRQREIASKGGRAAHAKGTAHEWTSDEARVAGRKGGEVAPRRGVDRRALRTRIASRRWKSRARAGPGRDCPEACATTSRTWRRFGTKKHPTLPDPADRKLDRTPEGNETGSGAPGPVSLLVGATLGSEPPRFSSVPTSEAGVIPVDPTVSLPTFDRVVSDAAGTGARFYGA
jgi:general stress protein YciG